MKVQTLPYTADMSGPFALNTTAILGVKEYHGTVQLSMKEGIDNSIGSK